MPVLSACAQPFSLGIVGGEGLTQDFQNYDLPPNGAPPGDTVRILGISTPQRWIAGATVEARLPLHLSVEADGLYHILQFRTGNQSGQNTPFFGTDQHSVTWELPVLLKYRFQLPVVKPFIAAGPAFRYSYARSYTNPSNHGMLVLEQLWLSLAGLVPLSEPKYMVQRIDLDREMQRQPRLHRPAGDPTLRS